MGIFNTSLDSSDFDEMCSIIAYNSKGSRFKQNRRYSLYNENNTPVSMMTASSLRTKVELAPAKRRVSVYKICIRQWACQTYA